MEDVQFIQLKYNVNLIKKIERKDVTKIKGSQNKNKNISFCNQKYTDITIISYINK